MGRPIVFLSDFGLDDEFVGICHGVIARVAQDARVIDLTHGIPAHDVLRGAMVLADAVEFLPVHAIYLAVVDPGVGADRRDVAVETGSGAVLVGPDNGVLSLAWAGLGGAARAVKIDSKRVVLPSVSSTFHGRDVLSPAAAHLATGAALADLGSPVEPPTLATVAISEPEVHAGRIRAEILGIDRFGNVQLTARKHDLDDAGLGQAERLVVRTVWQTLTMHRTSTFSGVAPGELAAVIDSRGRLAVIRNGGSAAKSMRVGLGEPVVIETGGR